MKKVSVIITTYNNEATIQTCIESILRCHEFYEIIIVDDGSTDQTLSICKRIKEKRIKIISIKHQGVSSARNKGMKYVTGDYLTFIDADDEVNEYIHCLFPILKSSISDYYFFPLLYHGSLGKDGTYEIKNASKKIKRWIIKEQLNSVCAKVYLVSILKNYSIQFNERIHIAEDLLFNLQYIEHCHTLTISNHAFYHYCYNPFSLTNKYNEKKEEDLMNANQVLFVQLKKMGYEVTDFLYMKNIYSILANMKKKECPYSWKEKRMKIVEIKKKYKGKILFQYGISMFLWSILYTFSFPSILYGIIWIRSVFHEETID